MSAMASAKKPPPRAARAQLVVSLGTGSHGRALRNRLERAASLSGAQSLSDWARTALVQASHAPQPQGPPTRAELDELTRRVERLEAHSRI